jgi:hypothetical protein
MQVRAAEARARREQGAPQGMAAGHQATDEGPSAYFYYLQIAGSRAKLLRHVEVGGHAQWNGSGSGPSRRKNSGGCRPPWAESDGADGSIPPKAGLRRIPP